MNKRKIIRVTLITLTAVAILIGSSAGAYYLGYEKGFSQTKNIVIEGAKNIEAPENIKADFSVFWQAWDKLKSEHINGKNLKPQDLLYGAIKGLANSLSDPNTAFLTPDQSKQFNDDVRGVFGGIGAEIGKDKNDQLIIIAPLKNTPAERVGLKGKDKILKINDELTNDLSVDEAVSKIRGEPGTKVTLTIFRDSFEKPKDFEITRELIQVPTLDWEIKDNGIVHVKLYHFNNNTESGFYRAMVESLTKNPKGLILDLRNNPGGFFDTAINMAGWLLKRGEVVVKQKSTDGREEVFTAEGNQALKDLPVVVLINSGSASASEILAGALRVNRGVKLIGEKSFGKGTIQQLEQLKDGSTLKITTANWLLPDGTLIEKNGLKPDYEVKLTDEDAKAERDPQLDKAIEILRAEINR